MKDFFNRVNIYSEGLEAVRELCERGEYDGAFSEYRKVLADRFLRYPSDCFKTDRHPGIDPDLLLENKLSLLGYEPVDLGKPINWLAEPYGDKQFQSHLGYMYWILPLLDAYKRTGKRAYLDKWMEIMDDFIDNHPWGASGLEYHISRPMYKSEYKFKCGGEGQTPGYLGGSWIALAAASRIENFSISLSVVLGNDYVPDKLIAKILLSLAQDHCDVIFNNARRYTPNQFIHCACELLEFSVLFWEMKAAPAAYLVGMQRLEEAIKSVLLPDGSDLEQSMNYNTALPRVFYENYRLFGDSPSERIERLKADVIKRCEFLYDISNESYELPPIAKTHHACMKDYFAECERRYGIDLFGREYKSVAFPYGGYYASKRKDRYLLFKASRLATGHSHEDCNSVILRADGHDLLIDCSNYNYSDDEKSMIINDYMFSTLAHNSVSVDGMSQITIPFKNALRKDYLASLNKAPIDLICDISEKHDAFEGEYDGVYGNSMWYSNNSSITSSYALNLSRARHNRKVLYIEPADVYIIVDRLQSNIFHKYTVSWNIAPEYYPENVTADGEIRIEKKGLPSLLIKSFSDATPTYESFYGDEVKGRYCVEYGKLGNCVHIEQNYIAESLTAVHLLAPDFEQDFANARLLGEVFEFCAKGKKYKVNINNMKYEER